MAKNAGYKVEWNSKHIMAYVNEGVERNLIKAGADLVAKSSEEAPVDTSDLRGNCTLDVSKLSEQQISVGYNLVYALRQHEELTWNHPRGGKAKFLEDPFNANINKYINFIAQGLWEATNKQ